MRGSHPRQLYIALSSFLFSMLYPHGMQRDRSYAWPENEIGETTVRLDKLRVQNYRCFGEFEIDFDPHLTILIASNGGGKTTILDAARVALWPFVKGFDSVARPENPRQFKSTTCASHTLPAATWSLKLPASSRPGVRGDQTNLKQLVAAAHKLEEVDQYPWRHRLESTDWIQQVSSGKSTSR